MTDTHQIVDEIVRLRQQLNEAAAELLRKQREAGRVFAQVGEPIPYRDLGITKRTAQAWQQLSLIPQDTFDGFLATTTAAGRTITETAARRLAPKPDAPPRAVMPCDYVVPPIDEQIVQQFERRSGDHLADFITSSLQKALHDLDNPRYPYIWTRYHGINDDGTLGDAWTFSAIASSLGTIRESVESTYYRAHATILGSMLRDSLDALATLTLTAEPTAIV